MDAYTREQLERGEGFFTGGRWTVIYRRPDGLYVTAAANDAPGGSLELVGGGSRDGGRWLKRPDFDQI